MWLLKKGVYLVILLIATLLGIIRYKKLNSAYKVLTLSLAVTFIFESIAISLAYNRIPNTTVYNIFDYFELAGYLLVYYLIYKKKSFKLLTIIFFILYLILKLIFDDYSLLAADISTIGKSLFLISCAFMLYLDWLWLSETPKIWQSPGFIFNNALLLFFTVNLLFWTCYSVNFYNNLNMRRVFNQILYYSNIFLYSFLGLALYLAAKNKKQHYDS